jgi:hypothetical protein
MSVGNCRYVVAAASLCTVFSAAAMAEEYVDAGIDAMQSAIKVKSTQTTPLPSPSAAVIFSGKTFYWISNAGKVATITAAQIVNNSGNFVSGTLSWRLFVTTAPITAPFTYTTVVQQALDPLRPTLAYDNPSSTIALQAVPDGTYYIHLGVFEFGTGCTGSSDGYCLDDYVTFPDQVRITNGIYLPVPASKILRRVE